MKTYYRNYRTPGTSIEYRVLYFYDPAIRLWTVYGVDGEGNQITDAEYGIKDVLESMIDYVMDEITEYLLKKEDKFL